LPRNGFGQFGRHLGVHDLASASQVRGHNVALRKICHSGFVASDETEMSSLVEIWSSINDLPGGGRREASPDSSGEWRMMVGGGGLSFVLRQVSTCARFKKEGVVL
jgi:hypothetical protein